MNVPTGPTLRGGVLAAVVAVVGRVVAPETGVVLLAGFVGGAVAGVGLGYYQSPFAVGWRVGVAGFAPYAVVVLWTASDLPTTVVGLSELLATVTFFLVGGVLGAWLGKRWLGVTDRPTGDRAD